MFYRIEWCNAVTEITHVHLVFTDSLDVFRYSNPQQKRRSSSIIGESSSTFPLAANPDNMRLFLRACRCLPVRRRVRLRGEEEVASRCGLVLDHISRSHGI